MLLCNHMDANKLQLLSDNTTLTTRTTVSAAFSVPRVFLTDTFNVFTNTDHILTHANSMLSMSLMKMAQIYVVPMVTIESSLNKSLCMGKKTSLWVSIGGALWLRVASMVMFLLSYTDPRIHTWHLLGLVRTHYKPWSVDNKVSYYSVVTVTNMS
jgi:hypothetical protein